MQIVSNGDNFAWDVKSSFLGKNKKNISKCGLLKILPRVLKVNYRYELHHDKIEASPASIHTKADRPGCAQFLWCRHNSDTATNLC